MSQNSKKEESLEELFTKYVERHQKEITDDFTKKMKEQLDNIQKAIDDLKKTLKESDERRAFPGYLHNIRG